MGNSRIAGLVLAFLMVAVAGGAGWLAATSPGPRWSPAVVGGVGFALGLGGCFVMTVSEWGAWTLVVPGRRLSTAGPEGEIEGGRGKPIEAMAGDSTRLAGVWYPGTVPPGADPSVTSPGRTVLLVHGFAEIRDVMRDRIDFLTARGWNVARLDMRGYGRSGGDRSSFGGREGADLRAWIDVVVARVGPGLALAVWGRSMGAAIAARAAAEEPRIEALVLESPYSDLTTVVAGWLRRVRLPLAGLLAPLVVARAGRLAGVSLGRPRPLELASRIAAPTLILHGTDDRLVPAAQARRLAAAFPRPATLIEVAGAGHGTVLDVGGPELLGRIAAFLERETQMPLSDPSPSRSA